MGQCLASASLDGDGDQGRIWEVCTVGTLPRGTGAHSGGRRGAATGGWTECPGLKRGQRHSELSEA